MAFAVSNGNLTSLHRPVAQAPYALRIADNFTQDYAAIYKSQPQVRIVVAFLARNIAQLNMHVFRRLSDTDRERLRDHPIAQLIANPNSRTTQFRLFRSLVSDIGIFDAAYWLKVQEKGKPTLVPLPAQMVEVGGDSDWLHPEHFIVKGSRGKTKIRHDQMVYFHGYNPVDARTGLSPIETLRRVLSEEFAAGQMREQTLRNGARMSGYLTRPAGNEWSDNARKRFKAGWRAQFQGWSATEAGGTPVLEDGMTFTPAGQSAVDLQYVESRKLTREEVAAAYFIPPPMVGILDNATFGNIEEQHKMLYQDTLGPWLQEIQQEIMLQLVPDFSDTDGIYVEFNMNEKLRGSFEEQAAQLQTSVGAPFMTRNEARARANLPSIPGGDALVVPLNVLEGGQASPTDSVPKGLRIPKAGTVEVKVRPAETYVTKAAQVLEQFFDRQSRVVMSALGAKAAAGVPVKAESWWDEARWDEELSANLYALSVATSTETARKQLEKLGIDPEEYDVDRTLAYLLVLAKSNAESINAVTRIDIEKALVDAESPVEAAGHVFDVAKSSRSQQAGLTLVTALAGFATVESVKQVAGERSPVKTWVTTSKRPRPEHAAMNGQSVPIDEPFSNGAMWPGDTSALAVDQIAGCLCDVVIAFEQGADS
ncbi:MAG: phage portal protein [Homoserinimonas sp.]